MMEILLRYLEGKDGVPDPAARRQLFARVKG